MTRLSTGRNVVHVMLDSLQADVLRAVLDDDAALRRELDGFTLFEDHAAAANWTSLNFPAIWSGISHSDIPFDPDFSLDDVEKLLARGYVPQLAQAGVRVALLPPNEKFCAAGLEQCLTLFDYIGQTARGKGVPLFRGRVEVTPDAIHVADLALFRLAPGALRRSVYADGRWFLAAHAIPGDRRVADALELQVLERQQARSIELTRRWTADLFAEGPETSYTFVHVYPPHRPFVLDEHCRMEPLSVARRRGQWVEHDWTRYRKQATCAIGVFGELVKRLKALGVYDDAAIILQGDHGLDVVPEQDSGDREPITGLTPARVRAYAHTALLVKRPGFRGALRTWSRPTSHENIAPTILDLAGVPRMARARGAGLFDSDSSTPAAPRRFVLTERYPDKGGLGAFHRFVIEGPVASSASWRDAGVWNEDGQPRVQAASPGSPPGQAP